MSFVAYFQYLNGAGKITARSQMDMTIIMLTFLEEYQKKNELYEDNFKEIQEILTKLVEKNKDIQEVQAALKLLPKLPVTPETKPMVITETTPVSPQLTYTAEGTKVVGTSMSIPQLPIKTFTCKQCQEKFPSIGALSSHSKIHKK
jgi:hypothetical protein